MGSPAPLKQPSDNVDELENGKEYLKVKPDPGPLFLNADALVLWRVRRSLWRPLIVDDEPVGWLPTL